MNRTLLIAGVGYLGSALRDQAHAAGWSVIGLSKSGGGDTIACDLTSPPALSAVAQSLPPAQQPDAIVHCASSGRGGPEAYQAVFVDGCANLLRTFPQSPLLFVSSTSVYGQTDGSTVTEESPAHPDRETSRLLLQAEGITLSAAGCVVRLAGIYGPGRSVILQRFLNDNAGIEEDGQRILNQIHRDDAASAILHLLGQNTFPAGQLFNIADSTPLYQIDCFRGLAQLFHKPLPPNVPRDLNRKRAWTNKRVSNAKLLQSGWSPRFPDFLQAAPSIAESLTA